MPSLARRLTILLQVQELLVLGREVVEEKPLVEEERSVALPWALTRM